MDVKFLECLLPRYVHQSAVVDERGGEGKEILDDK